MDYLRDQEQQRKRPSLEIRRHSRQPSQTREPGAEEVAIEDDMDYLRNTEQGDVSRKTSKTHHKKRSSLGQIGANAKNMITGRFGDAFKRFESNENKQNPGTVTPEARDLDQEPPLLSPIAGSEATPSRHSDMNSEIDETEDLPPDVKRELERQKLAQEEKRVAAAAEEYRNRVASQGTGTVPPTRASTIQKRVQSLLDEGRQSPQPKRTADGYGRYTDNPETEVKPAIQPPMPIASGNKPPVIAPKPAINSNSTGNPYLKQRQQPSQQHAASATPPPPALTESVPLQRVVSRPSAPPKPKTLRTGGPVQWPPPQSQDGDKQAQSESTSRLAALLAKDLEGVPDYPPVGSGSQQLQTANVAVDTSSDLVEFSPTSADDLESFSKRYPSLSGIEMVETEIDGGTRRTMRVKDI